MADTPGQAAMQATIAGLQSRSTALRKAAVNPRSGERALLEAALTELDAAIDALGAAGGGERAAGKDGPGAGQSDRRLLQAVFGQVSVPLLVVDAEGTIRRANSAACELLGVGPGYATGRTLASMIEAGGHAPLRSRLAAVRRTGTRGSTECSLLTDAGEVTCVLDIQPLAIRGDDDRLLVAVQTADRRGYRADGRAPVPVPVRWRARAAAGRGDRRRDPAD